MINPYESPSSKQLSENHEPGKVRPYRDLGCSVAIGVLGIGAIAWVKVSAAKINSPGNLMDLAHILAWVAGSTATLGSLIGLLTCSIQFSIVWMQYRKLGRPALIAITILGIAVLSIAQAIYLLRS